MYSENILIRELSYLRPDLAAIHICIIIGIYLHFFCSIFEFEFTTFPGRPEEKRGQSPYSGVAT